jgi:signal transduction histidine kinase/ActR/RegA family two-component response regulator
VLTREQLLLVALATPENRAATARELAQALGARGLIVFVRDEEIGVLMPAPGFPQTLQNGRRWRDFTAVAASRGRHDDRFALRAGEEPVDVRALAASDGSVLALIGGAPRLPDAEGMVQLLPLLARALRAEQTIIAASGRAEAARHAAAQAQSLGEKLSQTRKELQRALGTAEEAARAKDEFLAVVSHELRTPLNGILGWAQLMQMGALDDAAKVRALSAIERNAKAQARLIEDILDLSRITSGRVRLHVVNVDLATVIDAAIDVVRPAAEAKSIRLQPVIDTSVAMISGDADRLQQVLWNLLSNAVTYSGHGGRIYVRLRRVNSHVEVSVSDMGQGIHPDFLPFVFDRFRQADNSATRKHGGLGLGLAITRHLVEMHGGTISAASEGEGKGSTFTVSLPLSAVQQEAHPVPRVPRLQAEGEAPHMDLHRLDGLRVLVVDDEPDARDLLATVLRRSGAVVTAVRSVAEALECANAMRPEFLISDIEMPGEDGYSLIRKVRSSPIPEFRSVPAIALTAYAGPGDRMRALEAGFQTHMAKPVQPAELVLAVANLSRR